MRIIGIAALGLLAACGNTQPDDGWQGDSAHVDVRGTVDGRTIDLSLDEADAADLEQAFCKREYTVPDATNPETWGDAVMPELEVTVRVVEDGVEKEFELGFSAADFTQLGAGDSLTVVPPVEDGTPGDGEAWVEIDWQWEDPTEGLVGYEGSAESGSVDLALMSGEPGADGVVVPDGEGELGLWFDVTFADGELAGSLTVSCGANEVE